MQRQNIVGRCQQTFENKKFFDITQLCFALLPQVNFPSIKVKVIGSDPGYLLKSFLLYLEMVSYIYLNFCVFIFFLGSADIKTLLPVETSRFVSISTEFLTLMKKVSRSPMVMDVLNIQNGQKSLERLADLLAKIQKALGGKNIV